VPDPRHSSCCVVAMVHEKVPLCCAFWEASLTMYVVFVLFVRCWARRCEVVPSVLAN